MSIFTETALEAIALHSQGWPRVINQLTINSFIIWFPTQKRADRRGSYQVSY